MEPRTIRLIVVTVIVLLAAIAPVIYLNGKTSTIQTDQTFQDLTTYASYVNGDTTLANKAAAIKGTLRETPQEGGTTQYSKVGNDGHCWTLTVTNGRANQPALAPTSICTSAGTPAK